MTTKRISYIDMAKGLGILLVVLGHTTFVSEPVSTWIYSFHMPLFFILSGMLLAYTQAEKQEFLPFLIKKVKTILIPYYIFCFLSLVFSAILDTAAFVEDLSYTLLSIFCFSGVSVLWFLPTLFFGEVLFVFIRKHSSIQISALLTLIVCLLSVFIANTYHYHYETDFNNMLSLFGAFVISAFVHSGMAVTFLGFGYYAYALFFKTERKNTTNLLCSAIFLVLNIFLAFKNGSVDLNNLIFNHYLLYFSAAFTGSLALIFLCAALPRLEFLCKMGKESLIIMVTHMNCRFFGFCYAVSNIILGLLPFIGPFGYILSFFLCLILLESITIWAIHRFAPFLIGAAS